MNALHDEIRSIVAQHGPLPFESFLELALSHPLYGYQATTDPFRGRQEALSAPDISPLFGEILGLWAADAWTQMGEPTSVRLIELGPARGVLMADALRACSVLAPFLDAVDVCLVEPSPVMRERQRETLADVAVPMRWFSSLSEVPEGPAIIVANAYFGSLPVRHYVRAQEGWREKLVVLAEDGDLAVGLASHAEPSLMGFAPEGAVLEIGARAHQEMAELSGRLVRQGGVGLVIDQGRVATALGETVRARRPAHADLLAEPGASDFVARVNFGSLMRAAEAMGALMRGPVTQAGFLARRGLRERAEAQKRHARPAHAQEIDNAVRTLAGGLGPDGAPVGAMQQVLVVAAPDAPLPPGFESDSDLSALGARARQRA
ncbi:MAG: hypothetical protein JWN93_3063 [Hyphomicrobiales bacterium]|nr:hypothetical protein [Hyphomicrobiales bacterium]